MRDLRCAHCGWPLGHIDEACPRCLPGFYYRNIPSDATEHGSGEPEPPMDELLRMKGAI